MFDVEFAEIIHDMLGVVFAIYAHFGLTLAGFGGSGDAGLACGPPAPIG
ncbi:MAG: hypothetical protein WDN04_03160 [Rhodospirillales bacterium]